jgi:hypothetical protein
MLEKALEAFGRSPDSGKDSVQDRTVWCESLRNGTARSAREKVTRK